MPAARRGKHKRFFQLKIAKTVLEDRNPVRAFQHYFNRYQHLTVYQGCIEEALRIVLTRNGLINWLQMPKGERRHAHIYLKS